MKKLLLKKGDGLTMFLIVFSVCAGLVANAARQGTLKAPNWSGPERTIDKAVDGNAGNF